jgi:GAF domain-containing protein/ActR/RegA family two-component response regulator
LLGLVVVGAVGAIVGADQRAALAVASAFTLGVAALWPRRADGRRANDRSRELEALHAIAVSAGRGDDLVLTAERTLEVVCRVARIDYGGVFRFDRATRTLVLVAHRGLQPADIASLQVRPIDQSHIGEVVHTGRPVVTDLKASRVLTPDVVERVKAGGYQTQLALPVPVNGETWGVMALISKKERVFDADELTLLQAVAHQVGQAVARASLLAESREKSRRLETLARLAQTLNATLSLDEVFRRVVDAATELFGSSAAQLWLVDDDGHHISLRAAAGQSSASGFERLRVGEGLIGTVVATRTPLTAVDALGDPRARNVEQVQAEGVVSVGIVPLLLGDVVLGALSIGVRVRHEHTAEELQLLGSLAAHAANAINNARLYADEHARRAYLAALLEINKKIGAVGPTEMLLASIAEEAMRLLDVDNAGFRLVEGEDLVLAGLAGAAGETMLRSRIRIGESLSGTVVASGRTLNCEFSSMPGMVPEHRAAGHRLGYTTYLGVPLKVAERTIGVLSFRARRPFTAREQEMAEAFAGQAALALEHSRLYSEAGRQTEQMRALADLARLMSETLEFDLAAQRVADSVRTLLSARSSCLYQFDPASEALVAIATASGGNFPWVTVLPKDTGIAGLAVREQGPVVSADVLIDPRIVYSDQTRGRVEAETHRALLAVPLIVRGLLSGALAVSDRVGRRFTEPEVRLAQAFADQAALALENARLYTEATRRRLEAEELARLARTLTESLDSRAVGERIVESVITLFHAQSSVLRLLEPDGGLVTLALGGGIRAVSEPGSVVPPGAGVSGRAVLEGRAVSSSDLFDDPTIVMTGEMRDIMRRASDAAVLAVPLRAKGQTIGALSLADAPGRLFPEAEVALLQAFADQAALALENARLYEQNLRQVEELSMLLALSQTFAGQLDRATLLDAIRAHVGRILGVTNMAIALRDEERRELEVVLRIVDGVDDMRPPLRFPFRSIGLMSVVLESAEAIRTDDYIAECGRRGVDPVARFARMRHWLGVPMTAGDSVIGVLAVLSADRAFTAGDERLLTSVAHLAALALRNARLFEERMRAYGELAAAQDQLVRTEKLRALGEMASGVAHDFNNLLASILGRAQLTLQRLQDPQLRRWLQVIERAALDGAQTVRRLQEFTRIRRDHPFVSVDLNDVVRGALEITQSRWREETRTRGVTVEVRTSFATLPPVAGDPAELREAMTNLILNAVDAMPQGGTLTLGTAATADAVVVTVEDSGVGIPEAIRGKIFDPFFTTKGPQGTGLGLSMTYGILSRHGARITVESREGRGTVFRLTFIPGEGPDAVAPAPATAPAAPDVALRCLVVDDEPEVGAMLGDVLETGGHRVVVLTDGAEAVARFRAEPFDLVLTDLAMPRVSGWQVAQAVKEIAPAVPVVLVTGFGVELSAEERRAHGVDLVVVKPLKIDDVLDVVAQAIRRRAQRI